MDLKFPIQNRLDGLTTTKVSKNQSHCFEQNLNLLLLVSRSTVLVFSVTEIKGIINSQTLNCPIEYLEEEELRGKNSQKFYQINSLIHLCSTRPVFDTHFFKFQFQLNTTCHLLYDQQVYNLHSQVPISH